jgi:hypothetical protein
MLEAVGITQHNDAITGTSITEIVQWYRDMMFTSTSSMFTIYKKLVGKVAKQQGLVGDWEPISAFNDI